jgi:hypothetical protein
LERRDTSVFFIPLLAAMALFYPSATRQSMSEPTSGFISAATGNQASRLQDKTTQKEEWSGGRKAVQRFFRPLDDGGDKPVWDDESDPQDHATLNFLIVTIPDPIDSGLPHAFDRYMLAIRQAVQIEPYFLYRFNLPWQDCFSGANSDEGKNPSGGSPAGDVTEQKKKDCDSHRYLKEPGFLLLSNPNGKTTDEGASDRSKTDLLLVYLVGETTALGIHKTALIAALSEISWFCGWHEIDDDPIRRVANHSPTCLKSEGGNPATATAPDPTHDKAVGTLNILGPSYSGSAQSLDLALSYWLATIPVKPAVKLISGSATAITDSNKPEQSDFYHTRKKLGDRFTFQSMQIPDSVSEEKFCEYLMSSGAKQPINIAMLRESGTVYGEAGLEVTGRCAGTIKKTVLPYPLNISQLRAASEKLRQTQEEATPQPQLSSKALPLADSLQDAGLRRDIPPFSRADSVTAEQVLAGLLSTISREHYKYVGILATDVRNTMFLAQEVREHSPGSVLFTYGGELLYLHPEINST